MREPMSAELALSNIIDIAKERCNAEGHKCDWECSLLDRSITVVTTPAAGMPHTPAQGAVEEALARIRRDMHIGLQDAKLYDEAERKRIGEWADMIDREIREAVSTMSRPAAQPLASGLQSVPGQSDKGTGVSGPENPVQEADPGESIADYIGRTTAEQADALRPVHYREAAAKLRAIVAAQRPLAARVTAEVLYETAASLRVHAARERAAKAHNDTDHAYWDGVGHAATVVHRTAGDLCERS